MDSPAVDPGPIVYDKFLSTIAGLNLDMSMISIQD